MALSCWYKIAFCGERDRLVAALSGTEDYAAGGISTVSGVSVSAERFGHC